MLTETTTRASSAHEALVLSLLREHGPLTRGDLRILSGLSRTTLYDAVGALMDKGSVLASVPEAARRKRGRPAEVLTVNPGCGRLLGIEFARRAVRVAAMNAAHEIVGTTGEPHDPDTPWQTRIDLAWRLADKLTHGTLRPGALNGIGVGVVGPVGTPGQGPLWAPRHDIVAARVRERFGAPALIDNNTRLATLAETIWGAAAGEQNVLYLRLSHGVGGGLVMAGTLHRGAHGRSGMFGHITVDPGGAPCECGAIGCLETVASIGAVLDACRTAGTAAADLPELVSALESGDAAAHAVLARVGTHVGRVLADVSHAVGPDVIVIGGELVGAGRALMAPIEHMLDTHVARCSYGVPRVIPAGLGDTGAALGALALLRRHPDHEAPGLREATRALIP
ncbi:putative NBD/HSP70 family sugar kinase [Streptomyces puniciscabiei]|uniref:Putative NBD/HSP70 family sugar kinase n=2 Tax=Streptomyces puniciscabiei TaxID=164348 RepID=A0A542SZX8_9ACTN|nr:ROK family transcriptional regulator [Streptomyces puniciscabiei]TQK80159.1 putative NBD/HSP70 family sugar kinase [Streptomyces puniciscabiei]